MFDESKTPKSILEGMRVVDFSWQVLGPLVGTALANFGAEVIKVESLTSVEMSRRMPPFAGGVSRPDNAFQFSALNSGKKGVTINLNHPRGPELAKRLVAKADIVTENFLGGRMARWGLGYNDLREVKQDIIMLSCPIFGQTGPFAHHPGFGGTLTSLTGLRYLTGWPDMIPQEPGFVYTDWVGCRTAVLILVAALDYRRRTGKGQYIDMSQLEVIEHFMMPVLLDYIANGRGVERMGNRSGFAVPHGVYKCQGEYRYCCITVFSEEEWQGFCNVISRPELMDDPRFTTLLARLDNSDELDRLVEEWTSGHSAEAVMEMMQSAGVPAAVVQNAKDLDKDPQLRSRHFYWDLEHPTLGNTTYLGYPRFSKTPYEIKLSPCLGEHNYEVFTELLGISDEEFIELDTEGVIR